MDDTGYFVECGDTMPNKLGLSDADELARVEYDLTAHATQAIINSPTPQKFDLNLFLDLHRRLFSNIYDFAGKFRTVNIAKPDSPVPFCYADFLPGEADRIFTELAKDQYLVGLDQPAFVEKLVYYASELNALHPFREGNGRTTRLFLLLMAKNAGFLIDYSLASRRAILYADTAAFAGNLEPLRTLYRQIVIKI